MNMMGERVRQAFLIIFFSVVGVLNAYGQDRPDDMTRQIRDRVAIVSVDFIDVRGGPARAYQSRGRLYLDESVRLRGEPGKEWVRVVSGSVQGWVPINAFRFPREKIESLSPERERRLSEFEYTREGRRTHRGKASGSGEGTLTTIDTEVEDVHSTSHGLRFGLSVGYGAVLRSFESNAVESSRLQRFQVNSPALASRLMFEWQISPSFDVSLDALDFRLADLAVDYGADQGGVIEVGIDAQDLVFALGFGHRWDSIYGGLYGSVGWFRQGYREVSPLSIALSTSSTNLGAGLRLAWETRSYLVQFKTGLSKSISLEQSPLSSGEGTALIYRASTRFVSWVWGDLGWSLNADFTRRSTEYSGESTHQDVAVIDGAQTYDRAREKDSTWCVTTGLVLAL